MRRILLSIMCITVAMVVNAQNFNRSISLNLQVESDTTLLNVFSGDTVTSIGVSGHITYTSELGFVRFVINDNYDDEYMIYESYRLFENDTSFNFSQKCEESCFFESYAPTKLIVQVKDAIVTIGAIETSNTNYSNPEFLRRNAAKTANNQKLARVQNYIQNKGLIWVADATKMSSLSYKQKANIFGEGFKTYGYEFYSKGFFSIFGPDRYSSSKNFVGNFDWRNRHGANDSLSSYYDGDTLGTGWITPVVCQSEGCWLDGSFDCYLDAEECEQLGGIYREASTCWIFGPTAQVEALTNLYYNQHLDVDLSEQYIACKEVTIGQNYASNALDHYKQEGVPLESCLPYTASLENCDDLCADSLVRVSIIDYTEHSQNSMTDLLLKQYLIDYGPLTASSLPLGFGLNHHCMALVGWGTIDDDIVKNVIGLPYVNGNYDKNFLGLTYWIYKESIGIDEGDNGFKYILHINHDAPYYTYTIPSPIHYNNLTEQDVRCVDMDGDGYYNWGIGPKPAHCPPCPDEPDGDDSNPNLGPLNSYGQCTIIGTYNASFEKGWDNWMQVDLQGNNNGIFWRYNLPSPTPLTGPSYAQDGEYYIYVDSGEMVNYSEKHSVIESPDIHLDSSCSNVLDFYYHMQVYDWGNGTDKPKLILSTRRGDNLWGTHYPLWYDEGDQGSEWQHATILLPRDVTKVRLYAQTGTSYCCDIAIDNITIGPWNHNESPIVITDTVVWDDDTIINQDIIVENGSCLTIKNTGGANLKVKIHPDSKIIVKPGGRLILDHCTLTSSCSNELWSGIEVWGNSDTHQFEVNGSYGQGYLEMKNGAVIENAQCAVELWRPGYWSTTGGIVHASDAIFRNNTVAVHALCYRNFNPGTNMEVAYNGHFDNCSFIINGGYIGTETFEKHVVLADVNGIVFQGCDFSADRSVSGVHQWCIGISAYDAGFLVNSSCSSSIKPCPMEDLDKSTFTGFCVGIYVNGDGNSPRSFTVNETVFTNNDYGIKTTNTNFPIIINNEFNIGRGEYCDHNYGIHLNNVTGFTIEENYFHPSSQSDATTVGIAITDCRGVNDVYHNTFESLSRANLAFGQNTLNVNNFTMPGAIQGLTYTCNDNIDNRRDFMVILKDGVAAIQPQQGSSAMPAGNTFRNSGFQFYNEGSQQIEYYYNSNETDETPNTSLLYRVNPHGTTNSNPCHSHYGNGPVVKSASEKTALESDYLSTYTAYLNLKQLYESSIDGGSTATQVADINNATPADMWQLRAQLLGLSPYVSGEVLTTAADRHDVFTDPVLFEILASNPDELKNDSLIAYLESKTNPLPSYMIELLRQIASGATTRTALVAQMGKYSHDYALAAGDIVRSNLNDTIANPAELRNWLGNMNDIAADRMAISSYLHEGDSASAFALANMLPELYGLQGDALADHGDYMRLLGLYQTLKSSQRTVYEMTEAEITTVGDIAETGTGVSKSMAESLMAEITGNDRAGCFAPDTPDPEGRGTGRGMNMGSSFNKAFGFSVSVTPNPATTWVTVDYTLPMKAAKATLTITNTIGTNVLSAELEGTQGSKVLDLRGLAAGVYLYTIRCGQYVENGKIVIAK